MRNNAFKEVKVTATNSWINMEALKEFALGKSYIKSKHCNMENESHKELDGFLNSFKIVK